MKLNIYKNKEKFPKAPIIATILTITLIIAVIFASISPKIKIGIVESYTILFLLLTLYALFMMSISHKLFKIKYKYQKEYLDDLKTNTPDILYRKDLNSKIIDCNKSMTIFLKMSKEDVLGQTFFHLFNEETQKKVIEYENIVLTQGKSVQYDIEVPNSNNEIFYFQVIKSPVFDENDNIIGTSSVCRNITQVIINEKTRRTFNETLAHDIKTPIIAQSKILELLLDEKFGSLNDEQKDLIKHTISSCHFAQEMVTSMLSTYKFTNEEYRFSPIDFDIVNLIEECINQLKILGYSKNISITFDKSKIENNIIHADMISIQRVIINILFNAFSYSKDSSIIEISAKTINNNFQFISKNQALKTEYVKEDLCKMFNKYSFGQRKFKQIGSGIGLFLAKSIIQNHNGNAIYDIIKDDANFDYYIFGFNIPICNFDLKDKLFKFKY